MGEFMITIDFKRGRFLISCPYNDAGLVANLPNRRFNKKRGLWSAPPIRMNIQLISKWENVQFSMEAKNIMDSQKIIDDAPKEPFPEGFDFVYEPFPFQMDGLNKIWPLKNSALFCDPGTGKSKISIDTANGRFVMGQIKKVVIIGLVSIKGNWEKEIAKHSKYECSTHILETSNVGKKRYDKWVKERHNRPYLIVGIESFSNGKAFSLTKDFIDGVLADYIDGDTYIILDESSRIKNHKAKRTEKAIELGDLPSVKYKSILTGTPVTQGAGDLFSQFDFLDPDIIGIGDFYSFQGRYVVKGGFKGKQIIGYQRLDELMDAVNPYIFQVRKRDVLKDLPDFTYQRRVVQMSPEQKKIYKELKDTLRIQYEDKELTVMNTMNQMQRFAEITGGHVSYEIENPDILTQKKKKKIYKQVALKSAPKLEELVNLLEEFPDDEQVVIWAKGKSEIIMIVDRLSKIYGEETVAQIHGGINRKVYVRHVAEFQEGKFRFMVGNPSVGGIGLDLFAACYMIYYNRSFSLEEKDQSEARIDRIGQLKAMTYYDIVCEGTIDCYVLDALQSKTDFAESVRDAFEDGSLLDLI